MTTKLTTTQIYTLASVLCSIFLAALDQTIVSTAAPKIAGALGDFEAISWIFSSYMLASTVMIPIYGRLSDIYGRRFFYLGGILVFLIGSVLCGAAPTMSWLIVARIIQGFGAGAVMVESFTIIGDIFSPAERGKWQGLISSIFGLASILGPLLGGIFADYASWRLVFFINLPIGAFAMFLVHLHFPRLLLPGTPKTINVLSASLLALTLLSFLFALVRSEHHGHWFSFDVAGLFFLSFILLVVFIVREQRANNPIFPKLLFQNRIFNISMVSLFFLAFAMFGIVSYIPLFSQMALRQSPSESGFILIPFVMAMTVAAALAGQIISRTGKYKTMLIIGVLCITFGMILLRQMNMNTTPSTLALNLIFVGAGMGITMPIYLVIVQSSFGHDKLGLVTSSMQLIRNIGSTIGTSLLGTLLINYVESHLQKLNGKGEPLSLNNLAAILSIINNNADQTALSALQENFAYGTRLIISCCLALTIVTLVMSFFLPIIRLRKNNALISE